MPPWDLVVHEFASGAYPVIRSYLQDSGRGRDPPPYKITREPPIAVGEFIIKGVYCPGIKYEVPRDDRYLVVMSWSKC